MAILTYIVDARYEAQRLDSFLRDKGGLSGSVLKRAKQIPGGLTMDGNPIRTIDLVKAGAVVRVDTGEEQRSYHKCHRAVEVVYEDAHLIVYNKPSDMPSHPSRGHPFDTLGNVFAAGESTEGLTYRPINRLDKDTSGLVFVAKNQHAAWFFADRIQKTYLALAAGSFEEEQGQICGGIEREAPDSIRRMVRADGQRAVTNYRVLSRYEGYTAAALLLETGRTHQIRVHLSHIGHPLLGDALYGGSTELIARQALHCYEAVLLKEDGSEALIRAQLPGDMAGLARDLLL